MRGLRAWVGFRQVGVRSERGTGTRANRSISAADFSRHAGAASWLFPMYPSSQRLALAAGLARFFVLLGYAIYVMSITHVDPPSGYGRSLSSLC